MDNQDVKKPEVLTSEEQPHVEWDDANMDTSYANVVNAAITREEMVMFFGTNKTWNLKKGSDVNVDLSNRIVMSPYAAKRMTVLLENVLKQYESRFGELSVPTTE